MGSDVIPRGHSFSLAEINFLNAENFHILQLNYQNIMIRILPIYVCTTQKPRVFELKVRVEDLERTP